MRVLIFVMCCISLGVLSCLPALAAPTTYAPPVTFNDVLMIFFNAAKMIQQTVASFASKTLYVCSLCALVLIGFYAIFKRASAVSNLTAFFGSFTQFIITLGIIQFIIRYGYNISCDFLNSFISMPAIQFGNISVSNLINEYFKLIEAFTNILVTQSSIVFVIFLFINFFLVSTFIIYLMLNYVMALLACSFCTILIGFAILPYFRSFITVFISTTFLYCLKLFAMFFVFNLGHSIMLMMVVSMQSQLASGMMVKVQDIAMMTFIMAFILSLAFACSRFANLLTQHFAQGWRRL